MEHFIIIIQVCVIVLLAVDLQKERKTRKVLENAISKADSTEPGRKVQAPNIPRPEPLRFLIKRYYFLKVNDYDQSSLDQKLEQLQDDGWRYNGGSADLLEFFKDIEKVEEQ